MDLQAVTAAMIAYDAGDPMRIHHFLKVYAFARLIGLSEGLSADLQEITEVAALVHDIGIHRAEALYGSSAGKYQEELGPAEAEALLYALNASSALTARVSYLVGHHHTLSGIEGDDFQILIEADYIVNASESGYSPENRKNFLEEHMKTESGKRLLRSTFCMET